MIRTPLVAVAGLAVVAFLLVQCGGSSPAQPQTPPATPTPTPVPTPTPQPLSVIPPCPIPDSGSGGLNLDCHEPKSSLYPQMNAAIDRVLTVRPDLFNYNDVNGGPRVLNVDKYMTAVAAAINQTGGICAHVDPEGEMAIKTNNDWSEHWIIVSRAGWNPPAGNWVERKYIGTCAPASF
ncbi:MAG TPA: hypothetical protein VMX54_04055 [Vicinamibacteria bacterium]|nr:hypothetical protein [Vicinamibacteria bacterium]